MEYLINTANVLYLVAYFMRDIRWLRAFTIIAATLLATYFYFRPEPLMTAVYWNLFFGALNAYHLVRLAFETHKRDAADSSRPCANFSPLPQRPSPLPGGLRPRGLAMKRWRSRIAPIAAAATLRPASCSS